MGKMPLGLRKKRPAVVKKVENLRKIIIHAPLHRSAIPRNQCLGFKFKTQSQNILPRDVQSHNIKTETSPDQETPISLSIVYNFA